MHVFPTAQMGILPVEMEYSGGNGVEGLERTDHHLHRIQWLSMESPLWVTLALHFRYICIHLLGETNMNITTARGRALWTHPPPELASHCSRHNNDGSSLADALPPPCTATTMVMRQDDEHPHSVAGWSAVQGGGGVPPRLRLWLVWHEQWWPCTPRWFWRVGPKGSVTCDGNIRICLPQEIHGNIPFFTWHIIILSFCTLKYKKPSG